MTMIRRWWQEVRATLALGTPMVLGALLMQSLWIADTAMIGRVGVVEVAAAGFTGNIFGSIMLFGFGLLSPVSILVARATGAGDRTTARSVLKHALAVVFFYGLAWFGISLASSHDWLYWFGQPREVVEAAYVYFLIFMGTMPLILVYQGLRYFCEARGHPWVPLRWLALSAGLNLFLNWVMIYGNLGCPALGLAGAGWATFLARLVSTVGFILYLGRRTDLVDPFHPAEFLRLEAGPMKENLHLGIPVGFQITFEVLAFNLAALMMGWFGAVTLAAHTIAISLAGLTFMVPLGLSFATSIRVGHALGAGDADGARRAGFSSAAFAGIFMLAMAAGFLLFREQLPGLFLGREVADAKAVTALAAVYLIVVATFQLGDGLQVVAGGALRGYKDVHVPTALIFIAFWVVCLPLGVWLGFDLHREADLLGRDWSWLGNFRFGLGMGGLGIWIGLAVGLVVNAIVLLLRLDWRSKKARQELAGESVSSG